MDELYGVKAGDKLAVHGGYGREISIVTVTKVGKLHIVTTGGSKFRLQGGFEVGNSGWNRRWVSIAKEEDFRQARLQAAVQAMRHVTVTDENLEAVEAFLASLKAAKEGV